MGPHSDPHRSITLNLSALQKLDIAIVRLYNHWIENAPVQYVEDGFFPSRVPVAVTSRFGQNQQFADTQDLRQEERLNWSRDCDYSRIRYLTVALASHLRYFPFFYIHLSTTGHLYSSRVREVHSWKSRNVDEIIRFYPNGVYTSPDLNNRDLITWEDLRQLPIVDTNGFTIDIYCDKGFQVPRVIPRHSRDTHPHGVLIDLRTIKQLFENTSDDDQDLGFIHDKPVNIYTYPQAGLRIAGHFQAAAVMSNFNKFITSINNDLRNVLQNADGDISMDNTSDSNVLHGISSQAYNTVMHSTRGTSAQHHDVQMGFITAALAGSWATTSSAEKSAYFYRQLCSHRLPHTSFAEKIKNDQINRDLRLENVYYINVQAMKNHDKNGM
jgi:hypothetical protein